MTTQTASTSEGEWHANPIERRRAVNHGPHQPH